MSEGQKTKNDVAWEALFDRYDILSHIEQEGSFSISASQIREYREPRLMAKFDHRINLPQIFHKHRLSILPASRKSYVISRFNAYESFPAPEKTVKQVNLPASLQSLDPETIPSEAIAINCALAAGILSNFLAEETLYSTVSGRMSSGQFDFFIQTFGQKTPSLVSVDNAQIEIDAAFEGSESLALLEAKRDLSEDFLVRQLYYPFRRWNSRITKRVRPIFLIYSNGIFRLYEYQFLDPNSYSSLSLVQQKQYSIENTFISPADLREAAQGPLTPEPDIPFPQADSFERVINLCELLKNGELSREQVTDQYAFDIRQTGYYTDAARYLGLADRRKNGRKPAYSLTSKGQHIMNLNYRQRQLALCRTVLQHRVFRESLLLALDTGSLPDQSAIVSIMQQSKLYHMEKLSTYKRRASTVKGWIAWMLRLTEQGQKKEESADQIHMDLW